MGSLNDNLAPLELDGGVVEVVEQFKYLGSLVHGGVVGVKLAVELFKHLGVFGSLHDSVFTASDLTMEIKRIVYQSVVLGVLLYGAETWAFSQNLVGKLDRFH